MTSRTLKSLHGHVEHENTEALVGGKDNLVTVILDALPTTLALRAEKGLASHTCSLSLSFLIWKWEGSFLLLTRLESQIKAVTKAKNNSAQKPYASLPPKSLVQPHPPDLAPSASPPFPNPRSGRTEVCYHWEDGRNRAEEAVLTEEPKPQGQR